MSLSLALDLFDQQLHNSVVNILMVSGIFVVSAAFFKGVLTISSCSFLQGKVIGKPFKVAACSKCTIL